MSNFDRSPDVIDNKHKSPRACQSLSQALMVGNGYNISNRLDRVLKWQLIAACVGVVAIGTTIIGFLFNAIL